MTPEGKSHEAPMKPPFSPSFFMVFLWFWDVHHSAGDLITGCQQVGQAKVGIPPMAPLLGSKVKPAGTRVSAGHVCMYVYIYICIYPSVNMYKQIYVYFYVLGRFLRKNLRHLQQRRQHRCLCGFRFAAKQLQRLRRSAPAGDLLGYDVYASIDLNICVHAYRYVYIHTA